MVMLNMERGKVLCRYEGIKLFFFVEREIECKFIKYNFFFKVILGNLSFLKLCIVFL